MSKKLVFDGGGIVSNNGTWLKEMVEEISNLKPNEEILKFVSNIEIKLPEMTAEQKEAFNRLNEIARGQSTKLNIKTLTNEE